MKIKSSTVLRNDYLEISQLARASGEPIFITNKGEADGVYMSMEAYERREKDLALRASILEAEFARLNGAATHSIADARAMLKEKYANA